MADKPLIVVALSGGVDSATAAAMLIEAGHRVVGMTMRLYDAAGTTASLGGRCCGPRDIEDARRVCEHLGIPFYVVSFEDRFRERVIDDFVDTYLAGETPNPCVKCNQYIKFTPLLQRARALGADLLATGHYARIEPVSEGLPVSPETMRLRRGLDVDKDQSYFLFSMPREELAAVRFPLGHLRKDEVRALAERYGLPNAAKAESQEICFVPDGDYAGFVAKRALTRKRPLPVPGDIVDGSGTVLGQHRGLHHYTLGQRRGLGNLPTTQAMYVVRIDFARNQLVVGPERSGAASGSIRIRDMHWLSEPPSRTLRAVLQVRHRTRPVPVEIRREAHAGGGHGGHGGHGGAVTARFLDTAVVAAPGQAAVIYDGDTVLGGGWISAPVASQPQATAADVAADTASAS